jgi:hypothetical protein
MRRAVLVVVALLAAAALDALPAGAGTTSTTAPSAADARQIARAGVLVASDFPAGWKQGKRAPTSDAELDAAAGDIPDCKPFLAFSAANKRNPRAKSPSFGLGDAEVTNVVSVHPSVARATAAMQKFGDARLPSCLDRLFAKVYRQQLADQPKVAKRVRSVSTNIQPVEGVRIGDEVVVYQGTLDIDLKGGARQTLGVGLLAVRVGEALSGYSYTSDADISGALQPAIVASVQRLQHAQSAA